MKSRAGKLLAALAMTALLSTINYQLSTALAQGTAFTYQGRLNNNGAPANGCYDLQFTLFASNSGGVPVAGPVTNFTVSVTNGLFTTIVDFGDVFTGASKWLEIAVSTNGANAFSTLTPRQQLTPVPYAVYAANAGAAAIASSVTTGSITAASLAAGAAASNLNAGGQSAVPSGGMILSSNATDANLASASYVKLGSVQTIQPDLWMTVTNSSYLPSPRTATAVWTGNEMIVWGGSSTGFFNDGGIYNPAANSWTAVTTNGAPSARGANTAVWTGSAMIVWGGGFVSSYLNDGGIYNPIANSWTPVTTNGAPSARFGHSAVWTGTNMIIWGGYGFTGYTNSGGIYNPIANSWTATTTTGAPASRDGHTAVWTGTNMIVWGGVNENGPTYYGDGAIYNPIANSWTPVAVGGGTGSPAARYGHTAVWTGTNMIIWGGFNDTSNFNNGAIYNPVPNTWSAVTTTGAPAPRYQHTALWTGTNMIIWGGYAYDSIDDIYSFFGDGAVYNPKANTWTAVTTNDAPAARAGHTAVWTGTNMIIWGGVNFNTGAAGNYFDDLGVYNLASNTWVPVTPTGVPATRSGHTAVWTGTNMIVWGGKDGFIPSIYGDGGIYNPAANTWSVITTAGAPAGRYGHTAVWTGSSMIVWGGYDGNLYFDDGGIYNPAINNWTALTTNGAPAARSGHTAVWTGSAMIVWGGMSFNGINNIYYDDGGVYNPIANTWTAVTTTGAPSFPAGQTAVWTSTNMIVWGGVNSSGGPATYYNVGGIYNPTANTWTAMTTNGAPSGRYNHTAVWTGSAMIVWGGISSVGYTNSGGIYNPTANTWAATTTIGAPASRYGHTAVWTGNSMVVWGGGISLSFYNDGGIYSPTANTWIPVTITGGAPVARSGHTAVWTGSNMIVWGGANATTYFNDTFIYSPAVAQTLYLYQRP